MASLAGDIAVEEYTDTETQGFLRDMRQMREHARSEGSSGVGVMMDDVVEQVKRKPRDHGRMPIPWTAVSEENRYGGFSEAGEGTALWTAMHSDSAACNVAQQERDLDSVLNYWRAALRFRQQYANTLIFGGFETMCEDDSPVFAYHRRSLSGFADTTGPGPKGYRLKNLLVVLNLTAQAQVWFRLPGSKSGKDLDYTTLHSSESGDEALTTPKAAWVTGDRLLLTEFEGLVLGFQWDE